MPRHRPHRALFLLPAPTASRPALPHHEQMYTNTTKVPDGPHLLLPFSDLPKVHQHRLPGAVALREAGACEIVIPGWSDCQAELVKGSEDP